MPRPLPPTWAVATTGAAWLWLAFARLQPWLLQLQAAEQTLGSGSGGGSGSGRAPAAASAAASAAAAADTMQAATEAALSSNAAAAALADPAHASWWQQVLLPVDVLLSNALDAVLLLGTLLLPAIAWQRWMAGRRIGGAIPVAAAGAAADGGAAAAAAAGGDAATQRTPALTEATALGLASRAASMAAHSLLLQGPDGPGDAGHDLSSAGSGHDRDGTQEQLGRLARPSWQPPTPPPYACDARTDDSAATAAGAAAAASGRKPQRACAAAAGVAPTTPSAPCCAARHAKPGDGPAPGATAALHAAAPTKGAAASVGSSSASSSSRSSNDSAARAAVTKADPSEGGHTASRPSSADGGGAGAHAPAGSVSGIASLNMGGVSGAATPHTTARPPPYPPGRALYASPLETVVVSCKLSSSASTSASTSTRGSPSSSTCDLAAAAAGGGAGPSASAAAAVPPPGPTLAPGASELSLQRQPQQYGGGGGGGRGGGSITAQRQLRELVEAAVRAAVASSNLGVLSTTVTSFPGCVHIVATVSLRSLLEGADGAPGCTAATVPWEAALQHILSAQRQAAAAGGGAAGAAGGGGGAGDGADEARAATPGLLAQEVLHLKHLLVQDTAGRVHCLWLSPQELLAAGQLDDTRPASSSASSASSAGPLELSCGSDVPSVASGLVVPNMAASHGTGAAGRAAAASGQGAVVQLQHLIDAASTAVLSSFALPTDADAPSSGGGALTAPRLLLPAALLDALADAGAGLRIVVAGSAEQRRAPPAALPGTAGALTASTVLPYISNTPAAAAAAAAAARWAAGQAAASEQHAYEGSGASDGTHEHLVVDHTLWPGGASWPGSGSVDLLQLLPAGVSAASLARVHAPVLSVHVIAALPAAAAAPGAVSHAAAAAAAALLEPAAQPRDGAATAAADIVHTTLAAGIPDAAPAAADQEHMPAPAAGAHASLALAALGEHVLLQLPLLLLPSAACRELQLLSQRQVQELDGRAAAAVRAYTLPLVRDLAAALTLTPAHSADPLTAAALSLASAAAAVDSPQAAGAAPAGAAHQQYSAAQEKLLTGLLGFLCSQGLMALPAVIRANTPGMADAAPGMPDAAPAATAAAGQARSGAATDIEAAAEHTAGATGTASVGAGEGAAPQTAAQHHAEAHEEGELKPAGVGAAAAAAPEPAAGVPLQLQRVPSIVSGKQAAKVMQQANAAHQQAVAAQRAAAATGEALQLALQQISALTAAATAASQQAADAQAAATAATQRAAAVEEQAERQRALALIGSPAEQQGVAVARGVGIWGLLSGSSRAAAAARAGRSSLLGGVMSAAEPPQLPEYVTPRDVLLGFEDERLEVQYRRLKALQSRAIDRAALVMQSVRQAVYVWRIARLMYASAGTGLSLVLLCKYEAVVLLPYLVRACVCVRIGWRGGQGGCCLVLLAWPVGACALRSCRRAPTAPRPDSATPADAAVPPSLGPPKTAPNADAAAHARLFHLPPPPAAVPQPHRGSAHGWHDQRDRGVPQRVVGAHAPTGAHDAGAAPNDAGVVLRAGAAAAAADAARAGHQLRGAVCAQPPHLPLHPQGLSGQPGVGRAAAAGRQRGLVRADVRGGRARARAGRRGRGPHAAGLMHACMWTCSLAGALAWLACLGCACAACAVLYAAHAPSSTPAGLSVRRKATRHACRPELPVTPCPSNLPA
jgi:hypothetical protein